VDDLLSRIKLMLSLYKWQRHRWFIRGKYFTQRISNLP